MSCKLRSSLTELWRKTRVMACSLVTIRNILVELGLNNILLALNHIYTLLYNVISTVIGFDSQQDAYIKVISFFCFFI